MNPGENLIQRFLSYIMIAACGALLWNCSGSGGGGTVGAPPPGGGPVAAAAQPMDTGFITPKGDPGKVWPYLFSQASGQVICKVPNTQQLLVRFQGFIQFDPANPKFQELDPQNLDNLGIRILDVAARQYQDALTHFSGDHGFFSTAMKVDPAFQFGFAVLIFLPSNPGTLQPFPDDLTDVVPEDLPYHVGKPIKGTIKIDPPAETVSDCVPADFLPIHSLIHIPLNSLSNDGP